MALYAFDGTWNTDKPGTQHDTNVLWFRRAYKEECFYREGVGTRFGPFGQVLGGITGAGGHTRVHEGLVQLEHNLAAGDNVIDVVGFSRGAALALDFVNRVSQRADHLTVRFLGIWDCVPSFGLADVDWDPSWELDLPDNVAKCYHALALDERRHTFRLHRLSARVEDADAEGRLYEVWFRGVHSDVGGGNDNPALSSITLNWMLDKAVSCGLPMNTDLIQENASRMKAGTPDSKGQWYDLIKNKFRIVRWNDYVHRSVSFNADKNYNNPPEGAILVDDAGAQVGKFTREVLRRLSAVRRAVQSRRAIRSTRRRPNKR
jgi:uncharacterized protein (DUF2235 family)